MDQVLPQTHAECSLGTSPRSSPSCGGCLHTIASSPEKDNAILIDELYEYWEDWYFNPFYLYRTLNQS